MTAEFVHLHVHSDNSMLDGFAKPKQYLQVASELGMKALGITDHGNVHGAYALLSQARDVGLTGVPGCEFYVAPINPEGARVKKPVYYGPNGTKQGNNDVSGSGAYLHLTVWAYNQEGMHNLFKLSTLSNQQENFYMKPRIDFDMLAEHSAGLVVSTGCPSGEISTRFLLEQERAAYEYAGRLRDIFGDRLFVEIMDHSMNIDLERKLLPKQLELAKKMGLPLLATNDAHYAHKHDALHHEEMLCSQSGARMSDETYDDGGSRFAFQGNEYYLKTAEEMEAIFPEKDFPGATKNTLLVAEMAQDMKLDFNPDLMPEPIVPAEFKDEVDYYKHLINKGFKERYGSMSREVQAEAARRIKEEMEVIHSSNFIGYMLTVYEYLWWTRESFSTRNGAGAILAPSIGPGRGSVGGSVHAYCLYISEIDPVRWGTIFERFLSAGRGHTYEIQYDDGSSEEIIVSDTKTLLPDIDGNFEQPDREPVKKYIHQLKVGDEVL